MRKPHLENKLLQYEITISQIFFRFNTFAITTTVPSTLLDNPGDSRFWTRPYHLVSRLEPEISRIAAEVCHFF